MCTPGSVHTLLHGSPVCSDAIIIHDREKLARRLPPAGGSIFLPAASRGLKRERKKRKDKMGLPWENKRAARLVRLLLDQKQKYLMKIPDEKK